MNNIPETSSLSFKREWTQEKKEFIRLQVFPESCLPEFIVKQLADIEGPVDIYCWYEGPQYLPKQGADFMKEYIFAPLYKLKRDVKLCLYSLKGWSFVKNVEDKPTTTKLGDAIKRLNNAAIECIYSSSFFQYCLKISKEDGLYKFLNEELPKKKWLFSLSENQRKKGMTIAKFFNDEFSIFESIKDLDVSEAYSSMQYVEGYYLIQESVRKGLSKGQQRIQIAFVLPNNENKYYLDYPNDIEKMLKVDFGKDLSGVEVGISFRYFKYGESSDSRPYIDKQNKAPRVKANDIATYFDYLVQPSLSREQTSKPSPKDVINN